MAAAGVTYHQNIRPIMAANCSMACHGPDPATRAGPVALDTYESTRAVGELVVAAVTSGRMPPWPADESCRPLRDTPKITDADRALFTQWQADGFPEGSEADYLAPPADVETSLGEPTRIVEMARAHTPPSDADEYYCGLGDTTFERDTYIRAIEVMPDQKTMVHHVQVHIVSSGLCTVGDNMYSWRPGGKRLTFSEGDAALLPAGSRFALQMHYNTFGKTPAPDKTRVALWELPAETKPTRVVTRVGVSALVPILTPGSIQSTGTSQSVGSSGVEMIGVSPHAHMIAKHLSATLERSDGTTECLTDVPDWNFEWQLDYLFKDPVPLAYGDRVSTVCDYDNSVEHQPTVDGVKRQTPITVTQGEGSSDEMCLHYVWLRRPAD
jgi:Copper type II ascorbate-dependent monooxygenase, C-terminal domain